MKKRIIALLIITALFFSFFSSCTENNNTAESSIEITDDSYSSETSSETISNPKPEPEPEPEPVPEPEPDFFTKHGQESLPTEANVPNCYVQTETKYLYNLPLDFSKAENVEVYAKGDYVHMFYWDNGFRGKIISLETGATLTDIEINDWETRGSLENGDIWIANTSDLSIKTVSADGNVTTVLDDGEDRYIQKLQMSDDGKYALALFDNNEYVIYDIETQNSIPAQIKTTEYFWQWHWINGKFALEGINGNFIYIDPKTGNCEKIYLDYSPDGLRGGLYYRQNDKNIVLFSDKADTEYFCMNLTNESLCDVRFGFAVTQSYSDMNIINIYDLRNGNKVFETELPYDGFVSSVDFTDDGTVIIAMHMYDDGGDIFEIYFYDLPSAVADETATPVETLITTQSELWQRIQSIAEEIESDTSVDILYGADGNDFDNYGYMGKAEKNVFSVYSAINSVKEVLSHYPKGMLKESYIDTHKGLRIYLCGTIYGMGYGSLDTAGGLTTEDDGYIIVVLDINNNIQFDLPHELSHVFDRRIEYVSFFSEESYMQLWEGATPLNNGYKYTYDDYQNYYKYTVEYEDDPQDVWFLSPYSRTYPTEDRAQIMEFLFNKENEFSANILEYENLRTKAELYCRILRECFESCKTDEVLYWEILLQDA